MDTIKPACKLIDTVDGNVFAIIGAVSKTLKAASQPERAREFRERAMASQSYDAVLALLDEFVEVE